MHLEVLVEDRSGKAFLEAALPRIVPPPHTFRVIPYKGIGRIPRNLKPRSDASKRILLDQLPRLLGGYGKAHANYPSDYPATVVVVCDADDNDPDDVCSELMRVLNACSPRPDTAFCLAVEEGEAWLLGDIQAILQAYPKAKRGVLHTYVNDSICGTWETLADAVFEGGAAALKQGGGHVVGLEKTRWAEQITPNMDFSRNRSPSFKRFKDALADVLARTPRVLGPA